MIFSGGPHQTENKRLHSKLVLLLFNIWCFLEKLVFMWSNPPFSLWVSALVFVRMKVCNIVMNNIQISFKTKCSIDWSAFTFVVFSLHVCGYPHATIDVCIIAPAGSLKLIWME